MLPISLRVSGFVIPPTGSDLGNATTARPLLRFAESRTRYQAQLVTCRRISERSHLSHRLCRHPAIPTSMLGDQESRFFQALQAFATLARCARARAEFKPSTAVNGVSDKMDSVAFGSRP